MPATPPPSPASTTTTTSSLSLSSSGRDDDDANRKDAARANDPNPSRRRRRAGDGRPREESSSLLQQKNHPGTAAAASSSPDVVAEPAAEPAATTTTTVDPEEPSGILAGEMDARHDPEAEAILRTAVVAVHQNDDDHDDDDHDHDDDDDGTPPAPLPALALERADTFLSAGDDGEDRPQASAAPTPVVVVVASATHSNNTTTSSTTTTTTTTAARAASTCPICLEDFVDKDDDDDFDDDDIDDGGRMHRVTIPDCRHDFCRACLRDHCHHEIARRRVPIACPLYASRDGDPCPATVDYRTVRRVLLRTGRGGGGGGGIPPPPHSPKNNNNDTADDDDDDDLENNLDDTTDTDLSPPHDADDVDFGVITTSPTQPTSTSSSSLSSSADCVQWETYQRLYHAALLNNDLGVGDGGSAATGTASVVECPHCGMAVTPPPAAARGSGGRRRRPGPDIHNQMDSVRQRHCDACDADFCAVHGAAHNPARVSCATYVRSPAGRAAAASERALHRHTKPCGRCGARLQKAAGCDHVVCVHCHGDMCWKCGTHEHLTGTVIRHCAKCRVDYRDHRYDHIYRFRLVMVLPLLLPVLVLYVAVALTAAVSSCCFVGCFRCGRCLDNVAVQAPDIENHTTTTTTNHSTTNTAGPRPTQHRQRGRLKHGVLATLIVIVLPLIVILEDFGIHWRQLDELFPEPDNEIPFYTPGTAVPDGGATE